jgi:hypothetical protein
MEGLDALSQVFRAVDGVAALAVAVWVISLCSKRSEAMDEKYDEFIKEMQRQHQASEAALMQLVRDLTALRYGAYDHKQSGLD